MDDYTNATAKQPGAKDGFYGSLSGIIPQTKPETGALH